MRVRANVWVGACVRVCAYVRVCTCTRARVYVCVHVCVPASVWCLTTYKRTTNQTESPTIHLHMQLKQTVSWSNENRTPILWSGENTTKVEQRRLRKDLLRNILARGLLKNDL